MSVQRDPPRNWQRGGMWVHMYARMQQQGGLWRLGVRSHVSISVCLHLWACYLCMSPPVGLLSLYPGISLTLHSLFFKLD